MAEDDRPDLYRQTQEQGTDPVAREVLAQMRDQLLIALIRRAGGRVVVPVAEIDATGGLILTMRVEGEAFVFGVEKKN